MVVLCRPLYAGLARRHQAVDLAVSVAPLVGKCLCCRLQRRALGGPLRRVNNLALLPLWPRRRPMWLIFRLRPMMRMLATAVEVPATPVLLAGRPRVSPDTQLCLAVVGVGVIALPRGPVRGLLGRAAVRVRLVRRSGLLLTTEAYMLAAPLPLVGIPTLDVSIEVFVDGAAVCLRFQVHLSGWDQCSCELLLGEKSVPINVRVEEHLQHVRRHRRSPPQQLDASQVAVLVLVRRRPLCRYRCRYSGLLPVDSADVSRPRGGRGGQVRVPDWHRGRRRHDAGTTRRLCMRGVVGEQPAVNAEHLRQLPHGRDRHQDAEGSPEDHRDQETLASSLRPRSSSRPILVECPLAVADVVVRLHLCVASPALANVLPCLRRDSALGLKEQAADGAHGSRHALGHSAPSGIAHSSRVVGVAFARARHLNAHGARRARANPK
mmetsp:Transcript_54407/g.158050  ORF Transcript_54407/g.158050 Transcript_54407/m.158050 type:complete len:435 (-) Transcript_54407:75-1379(-)